MNTDIKECEFCNRNRKSYHFGYVDGFNKASEPILIAKALSNNPIIISETDYQLINLLKECAHAIDIAITDEMGLDGSAGSLLIMRISTLLQGYKTEGT
jgi:hypothetical protein